MNYLPSSVVCVVGWCPVQNWAIGFVEDSSTGNWKHTARWSNYPVSLWSRQGRTLATTRIVIVGGFTAFGSGRWLAVTVQKAGKTGVC